MLKVSGTFLFIIILVSGCQTTRIYIVDGDIVEKKKIIRLISVPDTIYYRTLWNGDVITEEEYDKRWDRALKKARKEIMNQIKDANRTKK